VSRFSCGPMYSHVCPHAGHRYVTVFTPDSNFKLIASALTSGHEGQMEWRRSPIVEGVLMPVIPLNCGD